ncbi:MAG: Amuc_1100 family pilus-like protein, partial [Kiritimatiellae bacterium]|nr:Amuc_1100 family pilus-like protein [Kiritimatiellia bacterium]
MNWTRYKLLIISGGITLVLSGVLIFWILSAGKTNAEIDQKISNLKQTQSRLTSSTPYPSEKNLAELIEENEKVTEYRNRILNSIREQQFEVPDINRSRFGDYVRGQWVPEMREMARNSKKGGENGVILQDPAFGLQTYLEGNLPDAPQVPKLMRELQAIAHLSRMLFESGISELIVIKPIEADAKSTERTRPVGLGGPPPMMGGAPRPGRGGQSVAEPAETRSVAEIEAERLFEWVPFRLEFRVY